MFKLYEYNKIGNNLFICLLTTNKVFKVRLKETGRVLHTVNQISFIIEMGEIRDIDVHVPKFNRLFDIQKFDLFDIDKDELQANIIKMRKQILLEDKLSK